MDVVNRATGGLGASHEGVTAESDPEPRVPSEDSPKASAAAAASESYTHVDTPRENSQCSIPKEAAPFLGDPKEAASAPHLPDTVKLINSPSTELAATKGTTPEPANQEEDGSTLPPKGKSQDSKAAFGIKKDTKATATTTGGKRSIPLKRDRMDPLKLDMTKPTAMPLTCTSSDSMPLVYLIIFTCNLHPHNHFLPVYAFMCHIFSSLCLVCLCP